MNTKTLPSRSLSVIEQYLHFKVGSAVCSVPYFNNKTSRSRAALRVSIGKGSPKELFEEVETLLKKSHLDATILADESLKKILVDANLGIDCSGFAYYILNALSEESGTGSLDKHISFVHSTGFLARIRSSLRPIENCDVSTFAHDKNSSVIPLKEIQPGDIITMMNGTTDSERDHILVIHQVDYQNFVPTKIFYTHAAAYPEDGVYGTGIKQGSIEIINIEKPITEARWVENEKISPTPSDQEIENRIFIRAQKSKTEVRRVRL
jgi:hypothetical protein